MFAYIDGDDIGLKIENCFMNNDEHKLASINQEIRGLVDKLTSLLHKEGHKVIFGGADGIIIYNENIDVSYLLHFVRNSTSKYTFSIGAGKSLRDAYIALRYAKSNGKNIAVFYDSSFTLFR